MFVRWEAVWGPFPFVIARRITGWLPTKRSRGRPEPDPVPPAPPPPATQRAIVLDIEAEQTLVAANRELITRFEQQIQATLARIWGEEPPVAA